MIVVILRFNCSEVDLGLIVGVAGDVTNPELSSSREKTLT